MKLLLKKRLGFSIKFLSILYALIGIIVWVICFRKANYDILKNLNQVVGCDGPISELWNIHDKAWQVYDRYTFICVILSLPVYFPLRLLVSSGKVQFIQYDIISVYLVFVPILLLKLVSFMKRKKFAVVNITTE